MQALSREGSSRWLPYRKQEGASIVACIEGIERRPRIRGGRGRFPYLQWIRRTPAKSIKRLTRKALRWKKNVVTGSGRPGCNRARAASRTAAAGTGGVAGRRASPAAAAGTKITPKSGDQDCSHKATTCTLVSTDKNRGGRRRSQEHKSVLFGERNLPRISE
jgi:hypothetical protein